MARRNSKERGGAQAQGKGSSQPATPEYSGAAAGDPGVWRLGIPPAWRDYPVVLIVLLAMSATAFIWFDEYPGARLGQTLTGIVWILTMAGLLGRLQARRTVRELKAHLARAEMARARLEPDITEERSGLRMRHISAWLVAILGIAASVVVWRVDAVEQALGGPDAQITMPGGWAPPSTIVVGVMVSVALALTVAANAINRLKTRRLARDFRLALNSEALALGTLGSLDVMISACLPTGERARFNHQFLQFVGRTEAQMFGHGWLEAVHEDDRRTVLELMARPLTSNERPREHDLCVRRSDGKFVWLHETLTPRVDDKGRVIEFIATAVDITQHVENVAALDKQIGDLKADLDGVNSKFAESKDELSKTKTSRNRFETTLNEAREEVKNLQSALNKAEAEIGRASCRERV